MSNLEQLIKEFRESDSVDVKFETSWGRVECHDGENVWFPRFFGDELASKAKDRPHVTLSSNNLDITKLLDAVEILVEGLELCALDSVVATDFREEYFLSVKNAKEALDLAEEKVRGA